MKLQLFCSGTKKAQQTGQVNKREPRLSYSKELDLELYDWVLCTSQLGIALSRKDIRDKALENIQPSTPQFKATEGWLDCFLSRYDLSLRKVNSRCTQQDQEYQELADKFAQDMKQIIRKYNIKPEFIVNVDESPFFWEYLPRKVISSKFTKRTSIWKRNYHHNRSAVVLASTASGHLLRPSLILKRTTPYQLRVENDIDLQLLHSKDGWMDERNFLLWLDNVFLPHVKSNQVLLLMDSFESHTSNNVLNYLKQFPNVHLGVIVGGTTSYSQPNDIVINKEFKKVCKEKSVQYSNRLLVINNEINANQQKDVSNKFLLLNNQMIISEKDFNRKKRSKNIVSQASLLQKMTIEDVYPLIKAAHHYVQGKPELIKKGFVKAGFISGEAYDDEMEIINEGNVDDNLIPIDDDENNEITIEEEQRDDENYDEMLRELDKYYDEIYREEEPEEEIYYEYDMFREEEPGKMIIIMMFKEEK